MKLADQSRFLMGFDFAGLTLGGSGSGVRLDCAFAGKYRIGIEVQLPDDQFCDGIALQNVGLRIHGNHVVVGGIAAAGVGVLETCRVRTLAIDHHPAHRLVNGGG